MLLTVLVLSSTLFYVCFTYYRRRYLSPLSSVPIAPANHFLIKYFGLVPPPNPNDTKDVVSEFLIQLGQDSSFSPLAVCWSLFGKPLVIVNTLRGIKDILLDGHSKNKSNDEPKVQRGDMICLIQDLVFGGKNVNNTIGEEWRWRRHVLLPSFQPKQLVPRLLPYVATRVNELMVKFEEHANDGTLLQVDDVFMDLTMDIINFYLYGRDELNYDIVGGRKNMKIKHNRLGLGFQSVEAWLPFGLNKTKWAQRTYQPARELLKEFIGDSLALALSDYKKQLHEYEEQGVPEKERSYQSVAACAFASGKYHPDNFDLTNDMLSLTFAGYDTTAHTLAFAFAEIAQSPELQEKLFQQVRSVLGPPPVSPQDITAEKLSQMPLVTAVYREALRKYPAVVLIPVHVNRDITVEGHVVPAGAEIWCNVRGLQMNPKIFPNPNTFDPSRFLVPDNAKSQYATFDTFSTTNNTNNSEITAENQYNFPDLTFTLGQHACMGKNLAILELRTVIAYTMNQFTCKLKEGSVIDTIVSLTTKPRNGVWLYFEKRT